MKNYCLYYSYKNKGDVLFITFDGEKKSTNVEVRGRVTVLYYENEIIGYHISKIKDIIKIRSDGVIYLPNKEMIAVINSILKNQHLELLEQKDNSGYFTREVDGQVVVEAIPGTVLANGKVVTSSHICTYKDLGISEEEEILFLEKDIEIGKDFFTMEVK